LSELYLARAEARAYQNNLAGAISDLDVVRKRAGVPLLHIIQPSISREDLLTAIMNERRVELFIEWGHRWLDLKRLGTVNEVMSVATPLKGGIWNSFKQLFPLPLTDLQNNRQLIQNDGY
jgi:starch-binding outer membrane protein, SusD/RagB family